MVVGHQPARALPAAPTARPSLTARALAAAALVAVVGLPAAHAALSVEAAAPGGPVLLDGTAVVTVTASMPCSDVAGLAAGVGDVAVEVALAPAHPGLAFDGPARIAVDPLECGMDGWSGDASFAITGQSGVPGLVPVATTITATAVGPGPFGVEPATASFDVTPEAVVDLAVEPASAAPPLPGDQGAVLRFEVRVTSRSNVAADLPWRVIGQPSRVHDGGLVGDSHPMPRGSLQVEPAVTSLPPWDGTTPAEAVVALTYTAPGDGAGNDEFLLAADPSFPLDLALATDELASPVHAAYETTVDPGTGDTGTRASADVEGGTAAGVERTPLGAAIPLAALAGALLLRRRS